VLQECGHQILVANARKLRLIYANKRKTDEIDALRIWLAWRALIRNCLPSGAGRWGRPNLAFTAFSEDHIQHYAWPLPYATTGGY
jgi:hypothetical protein